MKNYKENNLRFNFSLILLAILCAGQFGFSQIQPELATALIKMGHVWCGVTANGDKGSFEYRAGFFPNDYDIIAIRGQELDAWAGAGFRLAATNWQDPVYPDSIHKVAIYGPTNDYMRTGKVIVPLTNYVRYTYPEQIINFNPINLEMFGIYDPSKFGEETYDQIVEVTTQNILGVNIHRKILAWTQNYNDDYIIVDVTFTNVSEDTLHDFFINMESNGVNAFRSNGSNPSPPSNERFNPTIVWQHYYGGRVGDSLRVFYEYSADDPTIAGDNMGAPVTAQGGRLIGAKFCWYSILHASDQPYDVPANDRDDFTQPKVTYIGTATKIPYNDASDEYGNKNYWAIRGGYSKYWPMIGDTIPGTFHGGNSDENGSSDYSDFPAGTKSSPNSKMSCSFGPYTFAPGQKIHIVYASGYSGLDLPTAQEVGKKWLNGTLEDPPNLPDSHTGYLPSNFVFPIDATEMDLRKDRWVSTGIDSVMKSARRAKWNFDNGYKIPQAPPPPTYLEITGLGTGVEIKWRDPDAEAMPNFAGYRIMRRLSAMDTTFYQVIYDSGPDDKATDHLYIDRDVLIGAQYYYYLQAKARIADDDPLADTTTRGKIIYSSRVLVPNINWINPPHFSQTDLTKIRIVPNPYNINDPLLAAQGWTDQRGIQFYNLPGKVTIKIFTENGDLVQVLKHDSPVEAGYYFWDMITLSQQVISSGVYIVVFQKPNGETAFQKFLVVR
ncbi:MAG TPA: hypothetical protein PLB60_04010 [Candidatus Marinimicrobia bacterium]|nr:hypothetical protein [Candidatus Neomarinimicrobiota bacterium]